MSHSFNNLRSIGGLNFDDSNLTIDPSDYRYALNIRNSIGDEGRFGEVTNVRGNWLITQYIAPYNGGTYPNGQNKVIGAFEDTKNESIVFFTWNSLGNHGIYRYWRNRTDNTNPFGIVEQIVQYNFGWQETERITSASIVYGATGDLCYWTDSVMPRKINLTKGNAATNTDATHKIKCWDVYLPKDTSGMQAQTVFTFKDFGGNIVAQKTVNTSSSILISGVTATFDDAPPYSQIVFYQAVDFTGATSFVITGAANPTNNKTYNILAVDFDPIFGHTVVTVGEAVIPELAQVNVQYSVAEDTRSTIIKNIADALNGGSTTAEACDCHLEICEAVAGTIWTVESNCPQILMPAKNWYGATLIDRFFDRCKDPFLFPPLMEYKKDELYEPNYVKNKVFQSRLQPRYDDNEGTDLTLGVWSQIPINNLGCDGTSNVAYNYIDINFNTDTIANEQTLVILKKITLVMREHNTGANRSILEIEPCDFLDYDYGNSVWVCHYNFYNDIISSPVDDALAAKLLDDVPLKADAELYVKNKIVEAGILEGYDAPDCIDAKVQMEFVETPNPKLWKVTGRIRVLTYSLEYYSNADGTDFISIIKKGQVISGAVNPNTVSKAPFFNPTGAPRGCNVSNKPRGGIFHDTSNQANFPFFGGVGWDGVPSNSLVIRSGIDTTFDQRIPEGGFPVYAAGTNYFTISKQITSGLPTDNSNAIDTSQGLSQLNSYFNNRANDLYSEFELNLPDGVYVIRLASHWCSFGVDGVDKLGKGYMYDLSGGTQWQKTSTNVSGVYDSNGTWLQQKEITITVSGGDVFIGDFVVVDLAPPAFVNLAHNSGGYVSSWQPINCYLFDDSASPLGTVNVDMNSQEYLGVPVEKALVYYGIHAQNIVGVYNDYCTTDHNGYWFGFDSGIVNTYDINVYQVGVPYSFLASDMPFIFTGTLTDYYSKTLQKITFNTFDIPQYNDQALVFGLITTQANFSRERCSTILNGSIYTSPPTNSPVNGAICVYQNGQVVESSQSGNYKIRAWGDMVTPNSGNFQQGAGSYVAAVIESDNSRIVDNIVISLGISCVPVYQNGQIAFPILVSPFGTNGTDTPPPYSPTAQFPVPDFIVDEQNNPAVKARKRGGNYTDALRLYDDAGRFCSVVKAFETYIPFITEDIGKYSIENFSGAVYPTGTYKYGKPSLKWVLSPTTVFPTWATTFQWMRTKNSIYGRYLQWVANQVTYLSAVATSSTPEIQTSFLNSDAVAIKISISNIVGYFSANNDSQVGYAYEAGDRLRLIADRSIVNYSKANFPQLDQNIQDFEITSFSAAPPPVTTTTTNGNTSTSQTTQGGNAMELIIKPNGFPLEIKSGTLFEIYNPKSVATTDEQIYYEVGEVVKINNGIPEKYSDVFTNGDTYWRGRTIIVNDDASKFAGAYPVVIEDASVSDFYVSKDEDIGRIGIIDPNFKQIYNPSKLRVSNSYQESSAHNGLSSFEELNIKELDQAYGAIKRLAFVNNNLVCIMQNKEVSNYIGLVTLMQASKGAEAGLVATSADFFGTEYVHKQMLGTDFAGSIAVSNSGILFGLNTASSNAWRYADDESVISDAKMINYFVGLSESGVTDCISVYDRYREEYILTITKTDGSMETIAWNDLKKRWTTFYSFTPECYGVLGSEMFSFRQGAIYIHNKNTSYNTFYLFQPTQLTKLNVVFNQEPTAVKVFNACTLKSKQTNGACDWSAPVISNDNGQLSRLQKGAFTKKEEYFYAPFKRDLNTVAVTDPIINGRALRSSSLVVELQNDYSGEIRLYSFDANYTKSERTST